MRLSNGFTLCYCLNCFEINTLDELRTTLHTLGAHLRAAFSLPEDYVLAVGLHFPYDVLQSLDHEGLKAVLSAEHFTCPTLNAFPFSRFQNTVVKERVYHPDWSKRERYDYTVACARLLTELGGGIISTLPGGFQNAHKERCFDGLKAAYHTIWKMNLHTIKSGVRVALAAEPEPLCVLRDADILAFSGLLLMCVDTAHAEVEPFTVPSENESFRARVGKIQLSAALEIEQSVYESALPDFLRDALFMHQTRANGTVFQDLEPVNPDWHGPIITHFHAPVFCDEIVPGVKTARTELHKQLSLIKRGLYTQNTCMGNPVLEIETYTWPLWEKMLHMTTFEGIVQEYRYIINQLEVRIV